MDATQAKLNARNRKYREVEKDGDDLRTEAEISLQEKKELKADHEFANAKANKTTQDDKHHMSKKNKRELQGAK